jgi:murein DD-endopeptidase MepM/ murein hydrolase activator NlpD
MKDTTGSSSGEGRIPSDMLGQFWSVFLSMARHPLAIGTGIVFSVLTAGLILTTQAFLSGNTLIAQGNGSAQAATMALAPISLGNPITAATLQTRNPLEPEPHHLVSALRYSHTVKIGRGDTLTGVLVKSGIPMPPARAAVATLHKVFTARHIQAGQEIKLEFESTAKGVEPDRFLGMTFIASDSQHVIVSRQSDTAFRALKEERPLKRRLVAARGRIKNSLYVDAVAAGVPPSVLMAMVRVFSWDVDFQRGIHPGDGFQVLFEGYYEPDGKWAHEGKIKYAALVLGGKQLPLYQFSESNGDSDYYDKSGQSVRKALLRTPINGARLSSAFGRRRHPVLGYTRMHKGLDFAAPSGTPIYAAGNGKVDYAGRNSGYGNFVRIRHNGNYATAYGHLSRIGRGISPGKRVTQGQIIGYVGSTGLATGPHLHYEILKRGAQVNPMTVKMPSGKKLKSQSMAAFAKRRDEIDQRYAIALAKAIGQKERTVAHDD